MFFLLWPVKMSHCCVLGGKHSSECTLILTEGDSAKSLAVSGLGVIGRDRYGVFPLRGKILNVREATHKQVKKTALADFSDNDYKGESFVF